MSSIFDSHVKKSNYLVCVDSDGCAIDSMDIKHFTSFGPCMVEEWNLFENESYILHRWNEINLYTLTRGINRFKGLEMALKEISDKFIKIEDLESLTKWVNKSKELSNGALEKEIETNPSSILKKALSWSNKVNTSIKNIKEEDIVPFPLVKEALMLAKTKADIAIVSSANLGAVLDEWKRYGLLEYTDIVLAQNAGTKAYCISELLKKGYDKENVIMCGDALGDLQAATSNGVFFYPIRVKKEFESWNEFIEIGFNKFINNTYKGEYQEEKEKQFLDNLKGGK